MADWHICKNVGLVNQFAKSGAFMGKELCEMCNNGSKHCHGMSINDMGGTCQCDCNQPQPRD